MAWSHPEFEAVIGLEVHAQLATESKIFCACPAGAPEGKSVADLAPNSHVCPICAGHPGTLPVLNRKAVEFAVMAGLATNCRINARNVFARKNYFYPDLPKGYQTSQYELPICEGGWLEIETASGPKRVRIERIHMEEDAGKNLHVPGMSLVNLNRAGTPLIEIVSAPDLRSPEEAGAYLRALHAVVTYLGVCDGNMQEGNFRCDANVSVMRKGATAYGTRAEIKNVNSFRFVERAIEHELARQIELVKSGGKVVQETRMYDAARNVTYSMRSKEEAHDYRYFPDPDLVPIRVEAAWVESLRGHLPELPAQKRARYVRDFGLSPYDAGVITDSMEMAAFFDEAVREAPGHAKSVANFVTGEVARRLNDEGIELRQARVKPRHVADAARLVADGALSSTAAKQALKAAWESGEAIEAVVARLGLRQVSDVSAIEPAVDEVLAASAAQVAEYRAGKEKVFGFLVGQIMKKTGGKANPALIQDLLKRKLSGSSS